MRDMQFKRMAAILAIGFFILGMTMLIWPKTKTDVILTDFNYESDTIQLSVTPESSATYIGSMTAKQYNENLYCTFKPTFGWPSNPIGAKESFEITTNQISGIDLNKVTNIFFNRPDNEFDLVITRDDNGEFRKVIQQNNSITLERPIKKYQQERDKHHA